MPKFSGHFKKKIDAEGAFFLIRSKFSFLSRNFIELNNSVNEQDVEKVNKILHGIKTSLEYEIW